MYRKPLLKKPVAARSAACTHNAHKHTSTQAHNRPGHLGKGRSEDYFSGMPWPVFAIAETSGSENEL